MKQASISHNMGNIYKIKGCGECILTGFFLNELGTYAMLVDMKSGNRWVEPIRVENMTTLTEEEFKKISGNNKYELIKVNIPWPEKIKSISN